MENIQWQNLSLFKKSKNLLVEFHSQQFGECGETALFRNQFLFHQTALHGVKLM
jgi:hypothetical protein